MLRRDWLVDSTAAKVAAATANVFIRSHQDLGYLLFMATNGQLDLDCFVAAVDTAKVMRELVVTEQVLAAFVQVDAAGVVVQAYSPRNEPGGWLRHLSDLVAGLGFFVHCRRSRTL